MYLNKFVKVTNLYDPSHAHTRTHYLNCNLWWNIRVNTLTSSKIGIACILRRQLQLCFMLYYLVRWCFFELISFFFAFTLVWIFNVALLCSVSQFGYILLIVEPCYGTEDPYPNWYDSSDSLMPAVDLTQTNIVKELKLAHLVFIAVS